MNSYLLLNPYTPPVDYGESNNTVFWVIGAMVAIAIILLLLVIVVKLLKLSKNINQSNMLSDDEKRIIKSFRASKNIHSEEPIGMETLSEEEKRLIEEYRKNT